MTATAQRGYQRGKLRLLLRLAYAHLSVLERAAARQAVIAGWRSGGGPSPRSLAIFAASLLPQGALRALHRLKRMLRR